MRVPRSYRAGCSPSLSSKRLACLSIRGCNGRRHLVDQLLTIQHGNVELDLSASMLGEIEHVVDQPQQVLARDGIFFQVGALRFVVESSSSISA